MKKEILTINQQLASGRALALATVIDQKGSGPRHPGTRMVIDRDGQTTGTIGGGILEADIIETARAAISQGRSFVRRIDMTYDHLSSGAMICGGTMEVLVEHIDAGPATGFFFQTMAQAFQQRRPTLFVTAWEAVGDQTVKPRRALIQEGQVRAGDKALADALADDLQQQVLRTGQARLVTLASDRYWIEPICFPALVYLFGAGHVSRPTARLASTVEFQVKVLDDREELVKREFFPEPIELLTLSSFTDALKGLDIDRDSYLVIVTRGHLFDRDVLAQALKTDAGYIGMIGSLKKRDTIYKNLIVAGVPPEDLQRVHCPIGVSIDAETPEEIAVSIVAELIQARAKKRQDA